LRPYDAVRRLDRVIGLVRVQLGNEVVDLLPGSRVVRGRDRTWVLPQPVLNQEGTLWVVSEFVSDVLASLVAPAPSLRGRTLSFGTSTARIDSVRVEPRSNGREIQVYGYFPRGAKLEPSRERLVLAFAGCSAENVTISAGRDTLLSRLRVTEEWDSARITARLHRSLKGYRWLEQGTERVRFVVSTDSLGVAGVRSGPPTARRPITRIVLDAARGGNDFGPRLRGGIHEKWVSLDLARVVADSLRMAGYDVVLVRNEDRNLSAEERAGAANAAEGELFLSFQVETYGGPDVPEVQCLVQRGLRNTELASRSVAGTRLVPWSAVQSGHTNDSDALARWILDATGSVSTPLAMPTRLLEAVDMPAVTVILASQVTSPELWQGWRERFARSLVQAVEGFAGRPQGAARRTLPWN
jgi:N-acetylmuramoyl-L-alanine amidase